MDLRRTDVARLGDAALRELATRVARQSAARRSLPPGIDAEQLVRSALDEAFGLGPLELLMADAGISEIMINGPGCGLCRARRAHRTLRHAI